MKQPRSSQNNKPIQIGDFWRNDNKDYKFRVNKNTAIPSLPLIIICIILLAGTFTFLTFLNTLFDPPTPAEAVSPALFPVSTLSNSSIEELSAKGELTYLVGSCLIKGEVIPELNTRIYLLPEQKYYAKTEIKPKLGERVFCNEQDAINNGWIKSKS